MVPVFWYMFSVPVSGACVIGFRGVFTYSRYINVHLLTYLVNHTKMRKRPIGSLNSV